MRRQDWPERMAAYVKRRDVDDWVAGWLEECGGTQGAEVDWRFAQRGYIVETAQGIAICVGRYCAPADGPLVPMSEAIRAWRVG